MSAIMIMTSGKPFLGTTNIARNVAGCTVALTHYEDNKEFEEWHAHAQPSISFLLSGTHQEDLFGKTHNRTPGDIKYVPAGEVHRCQYYTPDTKKINLDFSTGVLEKMNVTERHITDLLAGSPQTRFTLLKLHHELDDTGNHSTASAQLLLYELFNSISLPIAAHKNPPSWVNILRELLHDEWNAKFDLQTLAEIAGIHPVTLSRYFPKYFSTTLSKYVKDIKIQKSLTLIKTTALPLTTIAYACGFADHAHFTRTFRAVTGFLPKAYRKI
jgi:AraC family transcriptional regulator